MQGRTQTRCRKIFFIAKVCLVFQFNFFSGETEHGGFKSPAYLDRSNPGTDTVEIGAAISRYYRDTTPTLIYAVFSTS